jgi:hypothetical protein
VEGPSTLISQTRPPSDLACSRVNMCALPTRHHEAAKVSATQIIPRSYYILKASPFLKMLRPCLPRAGLLLKSFRRGLRSLPPLSHNFQDGVPGLLSPAGFDMAWTQYQSLMIEKLDALTVGTPITLPRDSP